MTSYLWLHKKLTSRVRREKRGKEKDVVIYDTFVNVVGRVSMVDVDGEGTLPVRRAGSIRPAPFMVLMLGTINYTTRRERRVSSCARNVGQRFGPDFYNRPNYWPVWKFGSSSAASVVCCCRKSMSSSPFLLLSSSSSCSICDTPHAWGFHLEQLFNRFSPPSLFSSSPIATLPLQTSLRHNNSLIINPLHIYTCSDCRPP